MRIQEEFPEGFPTFIVLQIFLIQPGVSNDNLNDKETITKNSQNPCRQDAGPSIAEKQLFLAHLARKTSSKQALDMAGLRCFQNELLEFTAENERRFHARLPSKTERRRCENEAFDRYFPQKIDVEDMKMRSLRESDRCENEAFIRCGGCASGGSDSGG